MITFAAVKHLPMFILMAMLALMAVVTGCGDTPRYDGRLVQADSLMRDCPDSALTLLEGLDSVSLGTAGDSAYRALLLTQARYRCYVTATSDSVINCALAYYRLHPEEREKFTRAYIYKGAVMEELGQPDSAMLYYKHAEAATDPADYFNLGYVNMRMGALYRDNYAADGKEIVKYEKALEYFKKTDNIGYQLKSMVSLGGLYCLNSPSKADSLLNEALSLAEKTGDTVQYVLAVQHLVKNDIHMKQYEEARQMAQKVLSMNTQVPDGFFYILAADAYACLQMPDSAEALLAMADEYAINNEIGRLAYLEVMRDIATARGDIKLSHYYENLARNHTDSLYSLDPRIRITKVEDSFDMDSHTLLQERHDSLVWKMSLLLIAALALVAFSIHFFIKKHRYKKLATELRQSHESQYNDLMALQERIKALDIQDSELKGFIASNIDMMREMIEHCHRGAGIKDIKHKIEEIIRFQKGNSDQWTKLFTYIDCEYNNIISVTRHNYPDLDDKDLLLLALTTLDCSCIQIATILGYSNASSIGPIRQRLAKKMNLDGTLMQYIQPFKLQ